MKKFFLLSLFSTIGIIVFPQFKAQMINNISGEERNYDVYSDLVNYRYEFKEEKASGIVIVKPAENKTYILYPEKKYVHVTECDGPMSRMNDPVQSYETLKKHGKEKGVGEQKIGNYKCEKRTVYEGDRKVITALFSEELNFPMEIKSELEPDAWMRLENVQDWKPDSDMFDVPEDYIRVDHNMKPIAPEPPAPEEWTEEDANIPFKETLERGDKVKITLPVSGNYKFIFTNNGNSPGKLKYHLYKNGKSLSENDQGPEKYRSYRLQPGDQKNLTFAWADDYLVVVEVYEGELDVEVRPE